MESRQFAVAWVAVVAGCAGAAPSGSETVAARLRAWKAQVALAADTEPQPLSGADIALLERAQIDRERFTDGDLAALVLLLRLATSLHESELPAVEAFGASPEGLEIGFPLAFVLIDAGRMGGAARLITAASARRPASNRAYGLWKWWEWSFAAREDYEALTRRLSRALLQRFERGDAQERAVVADLFGRPGMSDADLPELRAQIDGG